MIEWLASATPFGATRHSGTAIDSITAADLTAIGLKFDATSTVYDSVHAKVSDNAANMLKGWRGFPGGTCVDHTLELSAKKYTGAPGNCTAFCVYVLVAYSVCSSRFSDCTPLPLG
jgi:hypothetical protein